MRSLGGAGPVLCIAGALLSSCSSDPPRVLAPFGAADCHGQLVEVARFMDTEPLLNPAGISNTLAIDGDRLYLAYMRAGTTSGLSASGGIAAVPLSGGSPQMVASADVASTAEWGTDTFWVSGGQIYFQTGSTLASVPAAPATPTTLPPFVVGDGAAWVYAHDAEFGYAAGEGFVEKVPVDGSAATVLADLPGPNLAFGGIADAGDSILLHHVPGSVGQVLRIPKDGSAYSAVRPDVSWSNQQDLTQWLAWDGENVVGPIVLQNEIGQARVAAIGTSAPQPIRLWGNVATRRGGEILSLQTADATGASTTLVVASSQGGPAGSVLGCGAGSGVDVFPAGIAANDDEVFVAYQVGQDTILARVTP